MSCILRVSGKDFDVDKFISESEWKDLALKAYHKGTYVNRLKRRVHEDNGFQMEISKAGFTDFEQQQQDAIQFLYKYKSSFSLLKNCKVYGWKCIDFGLDTFPPNNFSRTYIIQPELMRLCAEYDLEIYMTNYFTKKESRRKGRAVRMFNFKKGK